MIISLSDNDADCLTPAGITDADKCAACFHAYYDSGTTTCTGRLHFIPPHVCHISYLHMYVTFHTSTCMLHFIPTHVCHISYLHMYVTFHTTTCMLHFLPPHVCYIHISTCMLHFISPHVCYISYLHMYVTFHISTCMLHFIPPHVPLCYTSYLYNIFIIYSLLGVNIILINFRFLAINCVSGTLDSEAKCLACNGKKWNSGTSACDSK